MVEERVQRKLTTILAADVVAYSRMMSADEEATLKTLKSYREIIDGLIAKHGGRLVGTAGDAVLAEFASAVEAVRCAISIQEAIAVRNADLAEDQRMMFRIGINVGDVMIEGDDLLGDGVNVAARLEGLCEPGGVFLSGTVFDQVKGKFQSAFDDLGLREVKNIPDPVRVYRIRELAASEKIPEPPRIPSEKPSIAVLPFANMSGDAEQEFFSDGITEDIITELSRFSTLFVLARNSTFAFKGEKLDIREIGHRLGARYVVEGSVRRAGNRIRVSAQLIDAVSDTHMWAERYDRDLDDIFAVQDEVTQAIVTTIEPQLANTERERARRSPPDNLGAWESYQRGMWHLYKHTADDSAKAQDAFRRAIELEPEFAAPHTALAFSLYYEVVGGLSDPADRLSQALSEVRAALAADEWNAFSHEVLGRILLLLGQHDASIAAHEAALKLNPNDANAHYGRAFALCFTGRADEALGELDQAQRLSPHDPLSWAFMSIRSFALSLLKRYDEALIWARRAQQSPSATVWAYFTEVIPLAHLDRINEARDAFARALTIKADLDTAFFERIFYFQEP
jgi:TolB-like protein